MECPSCQNAIADGGRFCPHCGHELAQRGDERRVATVLFADLVGFTSMSEAADPEQVKNKVDSCFERLVAIIESFGGKVDKIIGDAIVALFGAPVAHEDDAERAVRAALRMQEDLAEQDGGDGAGIRMRVGVNTGEVLVGALRAGGDYTAMGDVVNTAQRLQSAAEPGAVLVGPATHAATESLIHYRSLGLLDVKGRDEAVEAWEAEGAPLPPGYRSRRMDGPLIGRRSELGLLTNAIDLAVSRRRAQLLLLVGDAGVGKTRLAEEAATHARVHHDARVLEGRCVPYGEANVLWPVAEAFRQAAEIDADVSLPAARVKLATMVAGAFGQSTTDAEVRRVSDGVLHLMGYESPLRDIDPGRAHDEAVRSLIALTEAYTANHPMVVVISDLHWADIVVLELLGHLMERLGRTPYVIIGTARHSLLDRWSPEIGRQSAAVVNVEPLDHESTAALLETLLAPDVDARVREQLMARSGGNPFFLEELAALLDTTGAVPDDRSASAAGDLDSLPDSLRGLVAARLDALGEPERALVEDAAVLGRRGTVESLEIIARKRRGVDHIAPALATLHEREMLTVTGERWAFRSDLVRDVAYGMLTKLRRAQSHSGIAQWMEDHLTGPDALDSVADRIAMHYGMAAELAEDLDESPGVPPDVVPRAVHWIFEAAGQAEASEHHLVGTRLYTQLLELLGDDGDGGGDKEEDRLRALIGRGRCRVGLRELTAAEADLRQTLRRAADVGRTDLEAEALAALGDLQTHAGDPAEAVDLLARSEELFGVLGDEKSRGEAMRRRGMAKLFLGDHDGAGQVLTEALAIAREVGDRRGEAWALQNLAWISFDLGRPEEAEGRLHRAAAAFEEIGDTGGLGWATGLLAWVRFYLGQHDDAEALAEGLLPETRARGDRWAEAMMQLLLASVRLWTGRAAEALEAGEKALAVFSDTDEIGSLAQAHAVLGRTLLALGRIGEAEEQLDRAYASGSAGRIGVGPAGAIGLAHGAAAVGDPQRAAGLLAAMADQSFDPESLADAEMVVARGLLLLQLGQVDEGRAVLEAERPGEEIADSPARAAAVALGAAVAGDRPRAESLFAAVRGSARATYADTVQAALAVALARAVADPDGADEALRTARAVADGTDDRLLQAVVRLAAAEIAEAVAGADEALQDESDKRLDALGISADGWRGLFRRALGRPDAT